jgi:transposase
MHQHHRRSLTRPSTRSVTRRSLQVIPADTQDRAQVEALAAAVQKATGETVELASVDQGYTGQEPAEAAAAQGIRLEVVKLPEGKRGFVLLPKRWVVERGFAWASRFWPRSVVGRSQS